MGGTRINSAAGLDELESFSAWQRERETNGSESEKQRGSARASGRSAAVSARPRDEREEAFREGEQAASDTQKESVSLGCHFVPM